MQKQPEEETDESGKPIVNPLYNDEGPIQTCAIHLDFPMFNGDDPQG